ncbi:MAG: hypothetical protein A2Y64_03710 [Candidatus Coatesbacteria bacterium RBG_13_66_14]|uniref:PsbP C-terminal domain-containing protein n=1 Tax=Candidatus Coatesbacteria bacterium RBG_13_66_14 TaxID=1817816 RepID=A0A1F5EWZ0_9BACT|nr:MAG: hypothetical protein A2Y64_03710 [Candidatus Coatesbacteria bacterium RBG_13_66_14]
MKSDGAPFRIRWLFLGLLASAGAVTASVELQNGEAYVWRGLTLFAPSDRVTCSWTVNEGEGAVALYGRSDAGDVAGNLLLKAPDAGLAAASAGGELEEIQEELVRFLAGECRARYGQVFGLEREDADGVEPAAALFFVTRGSDGERRVRAYAFLTRDGVYLLYLACAPEVARRLGAELDRLVGELYFR